MKKLILVLGIALMAVSCNKTDDDSVNSTNSLSKITGTWEQIDDEPGNTTLTNYWVFTEDNELYILSHDENNLRKKYKYLFQAQENILNINGDLMKLSFNNNIMQLEYQHNNDWELYQLEKSSGINPDQWIKEAEKGDTVFSVDSLSFILGLTWTGNSVWISGQDRYLYEIEMVNGSIINEIETEAFGNLSYAEDHFLLALYGSIAKVNPQTGQTVSTIDLPGFYLNRAICYDGADYWIFSYYDMDERVLARITPDGTVASNTPLDLVVNDMAWHNGSIWILSSDSHLIEFNPSTMKAKETYQIKGFNHPGETACIESINGQLWLVDKSNGFYKISIP